MKGPWLLAMGLPLKVKSFWILPRSNFHPSTNQKHLSILLFTDFWNTHLPLVMRYRFRFFFSSRAPPSDPSPAVSMLRHYRPAASPRHRRPACEPPHREVTPPRASAAAARASAVVMRKRGEEDDEVREGEEICVYDM